MKKGKILTWGIVIAVIASISILAITQNNTQPVILDNPKTDDTASVSLNPNADSPTLNDSSSPQGEEFWTDENGNRHYTITAEDSPSIER